MPNIGDAIEVNLLDSRIHGIVTGFNKKAGESIVEFRPGTHPLQAGEVGTHWTRHSNIVSTTPAGSMVFEIGFVVAAHFNGRDFMRSFGKLQEHAEKFMRSRIDTWPLRVIPAEVCFAANGNVRMWRTVR